MYVKKSSGLCHFILDLLMKTERVIIYHEIPDYN